MTAPILERPEVDPSLAYDVVDGVLVERPMSVVSGKVAARLILAVGPAAMAGDLGDVYTSDTGFEVFEGPSRFRYPDFSFVRRDRIDPNDPTPTYYHFPPDIAAEVVSPTDRAAAVEAKARAWIGVGVPLVWVLFPESRSVHVYRAGGQDEILGPEDVLTADGILPGVSVPVGVLLPEQRAVSA